MFRGHLEIAVESWRLPLWRVLPQRRLAGACRHAQSMPLLAATPQAQGWGCSAGDLQITTDFYRAIVRMQADAQSSRRPGHIVLLAAEGREHRCGRDRAGTLRDNDRVEMTQNDSECLLRLEARGERLRGNHAALAPAAHVIEIAQAIKNSGSRTLSFRFLIIGRGSKRARLRNNKTDRQVTLAQPQGFHRSLVGGWLRAGGRRDGRGLLACGAIGPAIRCRASSAHEPRVLRLGGRSPSCQSPPTAGGMATARTASVVPHRRQRRTHDRPAHSGWRAPRTKPNNWPNGTPGQPVPLLQSPRLIVQTAARLAATSLKPIPADGPLPKPEEGIGAPSRATRDRHAVTLFPWPRSSTPCRRRSLKTEAPAKPADSVLKHRRPSRKPRAAAAHRVAGHHW